MPYIIQCTATNYFVGNYGLTGSFSKAKRLNSYQSAQSLADRFQKATKQTFVVRAIAK